MIVFFFITPYLTSLLSSYLFSLILFLVISPLTSPSRFIFPSLLLPSSLSISHHRLFTPFHAFIILYASPSTNFLFSSFYYICLSSPLSQFCFTSVFFTHFKIYPKLIHLYLYLYISIINLRIINIFLWRTNPIFLYVYKSNVNLY